MIVSAVLRFWDQISVEALHFNTERDQGSEYHQEQWQHSLASGVYFFRVDATSLDGSRTTFTEVRKMLVVK